MAQKTLYIISEEEDRAADYQIGDLEEFGGREFRSLQPLWKNGRKQVDKLLVRFSNCGARTGTAIFIEDEEPNDTVWFVLSTDAKKRYFRERFHELRDAVNRMSLEEFSTKSPDAVSEMLNSKSGDLVYAFESGLETLDDFIRRATPGKPYYMAMAFQIVDF
jgi:hypothetical protein